VSTTGAPVGSADRPPRLKLMAALDFLRFVAFPVLLLGLLTAPTAASVPEQARAQSHHPPFVVRPSDAAATIAAPRTAAAKRALRTGYLPRDASAYSRKKVVADTSASGADVAPRAALLLDAAVGHEGLADPGIAPSDSVGAIGGETPTSSTPRYIELVNQRYEIRNTTLADGWYLAASGGLSDLARDDSPYLIEPQIIWDPGSDRFYYLVLDAATGDFDFGYSKVPAPNSSSDFCHYTVNFGYDTEFPDSPKLGDSRNFLLIGTNVFSDGGDFIRSDADWISKPPDGTTCVTTDRLLAGQQTDLRNGDDSPAFAPVPATQLDPRNAGWIVAANDASGDALSVFAVTRNPDDTATIEATGTAIAVSAFTVPPNAPQAGSAALIDTLDGRLTQAQAAFDPTRGKLAIWT
jgi:hypothetical protein